MANEDLQTSSIASTTLDSWATTPSTWRQNSEIEFRVRRKGQPTRRLRLPGARYTLGSGTGCSIPLEDAALRPLHAVLIRDEERILVRAYSVPFQINNSRVTEGLLSIGDRLRLGSYEFELLDAALDSKNSAGQMISPGMVGQDEHGETHKDEWSKSFHEEAKQWRALKQDTERREEWCQTRERELQEQDASLTKKMEMLRNREEALQTQESAAAEVHDEFLQHYQELVGHRDELKLQQDELATGREHLRLQQERLDGRDRLHRQQIDNLIGEQEQFKRDEAIAQQKLAESEGQLHDSRQQAEAATSAVTQMREKFSSVSEQLTQLSQHQASLQQLETQRTHEHQHRTDELELARDEALAKCEYISAQHDNVTTQRDEMAFQRNELAVQRDELLAERDDIAIERDDFAMERDEIKACCQELELIQEQLRLEIEELQGEIARTRIDAESLEQDCWEARHTISNLEDTIRDQDDRYETDRQSWTSEVDSLRKNIDELSLDLESAQVQLAQLREDNIRLADQLIGATAERDEARAEREAAIEQREVAQQACDIAKMDCESARRELETARLDVKLARQERDEAAAFRDQIVAQRDEQSLNHDEMTQKCDELASEQATWTEQKSQADRRYQEARSHLADARGKCERAVRARDEAEAARLVAEEKLAIATADLQAMQAERDLAIAGQEDLRRQRDNAVQDARDTRELFDRSNRDHDDTLDLIERLEQKTRAVMGDFEPDLTGAESPRLSLLDLEINTEVDHDATIQPVDNIDADNGIEMTLSAPELNAINEPLDTDDVWPTYSSNESKLVDASTKTFPPALEELRTSDCREDITLSQPAAPQAAECTNENLNSAVAPTDSESDDSDKQQVAQEMEPITAPSLSIVARDDDAIDAAAAADDSIEAYMNRLLQRVQGRITDAAPLAAPTQQDDEEEQDQESVAAKSVIAIASVSDEPDSHNASPTPCTEVSKRENVQPPKSKPSSSPVRNKVSRSQKSTSQTKLKYAQMTMALLCGGAAVVLVTSPMLKIVAAVAAVVIAAICAKETIALKTEVTRPSNSKRERSQNDIVATKAAA